MSPEVQRFGPPMHDGVRPEFYRQLRWYACRTRPRTEKRVERLLSDRGVEAFLPSVARERTWSDRTKVIEFPLFPGYVFGHFKLSDVIRVSSVPGLVAVVRLGGRPAPIDDHEIENVRTFAAALARTDQRPEPDPLRKGQRVVVTEGCFEGVEGVVVQLRGRRRVLVGITAVGQGLSVEIGVAAVQPVRHGGSH